MTKAASLKKLDDWWLKQKHQTKFFDKAGVPLSLAQWCELFEDFSYRQVAHDMVGGVGISTVWLGIDHNFAGKGPPVIFETMVFGLAELGLAEREQWRWSTLEEAQAGHAEVLAQVTSRIEELVAGADLQ